MRPYFARRPLVLNRPLRSILKECRHSVSPVRNIFLSPSKLDSHSSTHYWTIDQLADGKRVLGCCNCLYCACSTSSTSEHVSRLLRERTQCYAFKNTLRLTGRVIIQASVAAACIAACAFSAGCAFSFTSVCDFIMPPKLSYLHQ